jgi:tRNA-specific 2-thiouridylase
MSGGVDSSVAALLLQERGYELQGATLKLFADEDIGRGNQPDRPCCSLVNVTDAREVAEQLGFQHQVFNFRQLFHREVIRRFADSYAQGLTPNPCIDCNRFIKFTHFWERAAALGCRFLATGHYARIEFDESRGRWLLKKAWDKTKDQTYVLYALTQEQLARTIFPLGDMEKTKVRDLAEGKNLINAAKPDSQDICFVQEGSYADFLEKVLKYPSPPGDLIDSSGRILGRHRGLLHYTIGQRRALGSFGQPMYVTELNRKRNTVQIGPAEELFTSEALVDEVNLITESEIKRPVEATVKIRYNSPAAAALIKPGPGGKLWLKFKEPQKAVTPGQAAVFYQGDLVLGGGTICPFKK